MTLFLATIPFGIQGLTTVADELLFHRQRGLARWERLEMCANSGMNWVEIHGSAPVVWSKAFFRMLATGVVSPDFRFKNTSSTLLGYTGFAARR